MNAALIYQMVAAGRFRFVALSVLLLIVLGGLAATWTAFEVAYAMPQALASGCQGGGGGC